MVYNTFHTVIHVVNILTLLHIKNNYYMFHNIVHNNGHNIVHNMFQDCLTGPLGAPGGHWLLLAAPGAS